MHIDVAYSLEWKDFITAEEAYDLFWSDLILDKRAFRCPEDGCDGQVTCANMDKAEQSLKQQPHFRIPRAHTHLPDCPLLKREQADENEEASGDAVAAETIGEDVFALHRPAHHDVRHESEGTRGASRTGTSRPSLGNRLPGNTRRQLYSVRSLVTRWVKYRQRNQDATATVDVGSSAAVPYNTLFESINPKRKAPIHLRPRVYWGKAWVTALPNGDYRVAYNTSVTLQGDDEQPLGTEKPAVFVSKKALEAYRVKRLLEPQLRQAAEGRKPVLAFAYAIPKARTTQHPERGDRTFINFDIEDDNLDMLCLHPMAFFEELKRDA